MYYLIAGIFWLVSCLPAFVLYRVSDVMCLILCYLYPYRNKVIKQNLTRSFPGKSTKELDLIQKKFYAHFCDTIVETIMLFSISPKALSRRIELVRPGVLESLHEEGKSAIVFAAHYGNWEWLSGCFTPHERISLYKPLMNRHFDRLMRYMRERTGSEMVSMKNAYHVIRKNQEQNRVTLTCFIADQSPKLSETQHWVSFMQQDTPVYLGAEKIARKMNQPVLFCSVKKLKRGYYQVEFIPVSLDPASEEPYFITKKYHELLEQQIVEAPEYWLWSHKRWKHNREAVLADRIKHSVKRKAALNINK